MSKPEVKSFVMEDGRVGYYCCPYIPKCFQDKDNLEKVILRLKESLQRLKEKGFNKRYGKVE